MTQDHADEVAARDDEDVLHLRSSEDAEAFAAYEEERELEYELEMEALRHNGFRRCWECQEFSMLETSRPTRNYGGGSDTFYCCANPECQHVEVCV